MKDVCEVCGLGNVANAVVDGVSIRVCELKCAIKARMWFTIDEKRNSDDT